MPKYSNKNSLEREIGIIFDMDGVIIDTWRLHHESWFHISQIFHLPWNAALDFKSEINGTASIDSAVLLFGPEVLNLDLTHICNEKGKIFKELLYKNLNNIMIAGFKSFLANIVNLQIPIALGTSASPSDVDYVLRSLEIHDCFKAIINISMVKNPKPHPEVYLKACQALGLPIDKCIGFEDSLSGITALQRAGIKCIAVGTSLPLERLVASGLKYELYIQDYHQITVKEILNILEMEYSKVAACHE